MKIHANAPLGPKGRATMVRRVLEEGIALTEAAEAAGVRRWDEGPVRIDLPARILRFVDEGDGIDDAQQWRILEGLPTNIGALKGKLRRVPDMGLKDWDAGAPPAPVLAPAPAESQPERRRGGATRTRGS